MESQYIPRGKAKGCMIGSPQHTAKIPQPTRGPIHFNISRFVLGNVVIAASEQGICWIALGDHGQSLAADVCQRYPNAVFTASDDSLNGYLHGLLEFIQDPSAELDLPLDAGGTPFQRRVWQTLQGIAVGTTATYQQVAALIGSPQSVRAVAGACASNPVAVVIPCHRVVRRDGKPSGYRWGMERKVELLHREKLGTV